MGEGVRGAVSNDNQRTEEHDSYDSLNTFLHPSTATPFLFVTSFWVCDSCAACHITNDDSIFSNLEPCTETISGVQAGTQLHIVGKGNAEFIISNSTGQLTILEPTDVRYAPYAQCNLLSLLQLTRSGPGLIYSYN